MTFSIAARCPRSGQMGIATSSKALAAGALVPYLRAGVGAVASQSFVNPYLGIDGLTLLQDGAAASERTGSPRPGATTAGTCGRRRSSILGAASRPIQEASASPGPVTLRGEGYVCLGNILAGEEVVQAMARAFEDSADEVLSERLMLALEAGQDAGGDRRGRPVCGDRSGRRGGVSVLRPACR